MTTKHKAFVVVVVGLLVMTLAACQSENGSNSENCDSSYPTVCIPPYPPDLDCGEIRHKNFKVTGADRHGFDRDNDGIGCET